MTVCAPARVKFDRDLTADTAAAAGDDRYFFRKTRPALFHALHYYDANGTQARCTAGRASIASCQRFTLA